MSRRDELRHLLADVPVQFWICPVESHWHGYPEPPRVTVEWRDGIAYCTEPGCGRSSADDPPGRLAPEEKRQ